MATLLNTRPDAGPPPRQIRFVHSQGQPPSKRRRINAACLTCRRRKTKCDGERPRCSTCTKNSHECLGYPQDSRRDGTEPAEAGPGDEEDAPPDEYNREDDDIKAAGKAETLTHPLRPTSSSGGTDAHTIPVPQIATTSAGVKPSLEADIDRDGNNVEAPRSPTLPRHQPHASITSDDLPSSPTLRRNAPGRRVPYFRYFGPTAIVPGFKQMVVAVRDRRRSTGGSYSGTSPLSTPSGIAAGSCAADSDVVVEDLPIYDPSSPAPVHPMIIELVTTFFLHVGCNYPFLEQAKFLRHVKEKRVEPILVDAVCAIAARFSDLPALTGGNDKMPRTERGQVFAQRARQATVDTFPCPSVGAVQACLLMAYEGFGANQDSALWMYLGLAIRMAVDLGLQKRVGIQYQGDKDPWYARHRSRAKDDDDSPEEEQVDGVDAALSPEEQKGVEQERSDTFWSVFVLDRVISSGTGRPVTIRDDDFELPFPEPTMDSATGWPAPFPIFLEIIHLYGRVCDVLNNVHHVQDLTQDKWNKLSKMEHQLTRLYKNWDPRLQFNVGNFKAYLGVGQGTTFILLHFWFHALFIILHQPTLLTPFGELRSELQLLSDSRELSMSSAKTICDILAFADLIDAKSFIGNPFTSQPIYIAACAFLMESSANASAGSSREASPPLTPDGCFKNPVKASSHSKHSLLASAANQNYQRCYNSLQQMHAYWGGIKYILTALDQKSKGKWDCETYTSEEYESTKLPPERASMGGQFARFEGQPSPKIAGPPIAWSLAGTANSPNSSLTLMYQNFNANIVPPMGVDQHPQAMQRPISISSGSSIAFDPIRHNISDSRNMFPPAIPQPNASAVRNSPRQPPPEELANISGPTSRGRTGLNFEGIPQGTDGTALFVPQGYTSSSHSSGGYDPYSVSPASGMADNPNPRSVSNTSVAAGATSRAHHNNAYYAHDIPYQTSWGMMGNMDAITFDSQEINIGALGLQQPDLMSGWLDYIPNDVLGLFDESQDLGQGSHGAP